MTKYFGFLLAVNISAASVAQTNCTLRKDQDSIKVYTCNTDTSKFKSIKAEVIVNTSLDKLEKFLLNFSNYKNWQFNTIEARVLKKISETEFIYYTQVEAPWPVSDRDMVVHLIMTHSPKKIIAIANSENNFFEEKENIIRVPASHSKWIITETNNCVIIQYEIQINPGGNVPSWLANWVCANAPYQSFKKLKKIVEEK